MASLVSVSTGAETEGVTPIFPEKLTTFYSHHRLPVLQCHPCFLYFLLKILTTFLLITVTSIDFTRVSPLESVTPHLVSKFTHKNIFFVRVSPPGGCHPGRSAHLRPLPLVTPLGLSHLQTTPVPKLQHTGSVTSRRSPADITLIERISKQVPSS